MRWWRKVTRANITPEFRNTLELYGETVIAVAMGDADIQQKGGPVAEILRTNFQPARDWLRERRDLHERREDRLETVEWADPDCCYRRSDNRSCHRSARDSCLVKAAEAAEQRLVRAFAEAVIRLVESAASRALQSTGIWAH
jgi:hypothetical protein